MDFEGFLGKSLLLALDFLSKEWIKKLLKRILQDLEVQAKQIVKEYVSTYLIPELLKFIKCGDYAKIVLKALQPVIEEALETFFKRGKIIWNEVVIYVKNALQDVSSYKKTTTNKTAQMGATEAGIKNAAKGGFTAFGVSAVVGGVFLYRDLKGLEEEKKKGNIDEKQYTEQKAEHIGEYAGNVIGSGIAGAFIGFAAATGPVGWAAIGVGAAVSFTTGKLGGVIAKSLV